MAQIDDPAGTTTPDLPIHHYDGAVGGWGSLKGLSAVALREKPNPITLGEQLLRQNKADGFVCVSCAWSKPAKPHPAEFCENGAKATAWDLTRHRCTPDFFAQHTLTELRGWTDFDLEHQGRLTAPMRYDGTTDKYIECRWEDAFADIGRELKALDPKSVIFYASGRASLETSYMYALLARMYGCNNLPDSSNMCHESTSVGLKQSIGSPVGTVTLDDFEHADCILFFERQARELDEARRQQAATAEILKVINASPSVETAFAQRIEGNDGNAAAGAGLQLMQHPRTVRTDVLTAKTGGKKTKATARKASPARDAKAAKTPQSPATAGPSLSWKPSLSPHRGRSGPFRTMD